MSRDVSPSSSSSGSGSEDPSTSETVSVDASAPDHETPHEIGTENQQPVSLVVFDFDQTILRIHSWGERIAPGDVASRDLETDVADLDFFKRFVLKLVNRNIKVAIASFGQYEVIQKYMDRIFRDDDGDGQIFSRHNITTPSQHGTDDGRCVVGGKVPMLDYLVEKMLGGIRGESNQGRWRRCTARVAFADDDERNILGARKAGYGNSALVDPKKGFTETEWHEGLGKALGMGEFMSCETGDQGE
jgi:hypothetical protein